MNCNEFLNMIDAFIDGELSSDEEKALREHASECTKCAEELSAAMAIRDAMSEMDNDVTVPLQTQAAWRRAVRAEAGRKKTRTISRIVYAAAAALVLAFGCTALLNGNSSLSPKVSATESDVADTAGAAMSAKIVGTDGADEETASAAYNAERKYETENYTGSVESVRELTAEYEAEADENETVDASGKHVYDAVLTLDSANAEALLNSFDHLGTEIVNITGDMTSESVIIHITIQET